MPGTSYDELGKCKSELLHETTAKSGQLCEATARNKLQEDKLGKTKGELLHEATARTKLKEDKLGKAKAGPRRDRGMRGGWGQGAGQRRQGAEHALLARTEQLNMEGGRAGQGPEQAATQEHCQGRAAALGHGHERAAG